MVFDKDLKRWVAKGVSSFFRRCRSCNVEYVQAKGEPVVPAPPPAPPRTQTASPSGAIRPDSASARVMSATPPSSQLARNGMPPPGPPAAASGRNPMTGSAGFTETGGGGIKRMKSSLAESVTAAEVPATSTTPAAPPPLNRAPTGASLDDLLSRPPSKRPASAAARKGARNRYVDVFQPGTEGSS